MRKLIISVVLVFIAVGVICAQERKTWEIEPSAGLNYPFSGVEGMYDIPFVRLGLEYRHILGNMPVWLGAQLSVQSCARKYSGERDLYQSDGKGYRSVSLLAVGEYRFNFSSRAGVFGGVGLGVCQRAAYGWEGVMFGFAAAPRAGIQLNDHVRLFFEVLLTSRYFNTASINFGWVF